MSAAATKAWMVTGQDGQLGGCLRRGPPAPPTRVAMPKITLHIYVGFGELTESKGASMLPIVRSEQ